MESKAENIVQNIGAIAETVSVFYNSIAKQVPKDVALVLTQHFMDLTINRRPVNAAIVNGNVAAAIAAVQANEAKRRAAQQKRQQEQQKKAEEAPKPEQPQEKEPGEGEVSEG